MAVPVLARYRWRMGLCSLLGSAVFILAMVVTREATGQECAPGTVSHISWWQAAIVVMILGALYGIATINLSAVCRMAKAMDLECGKPEPTLEQLQALMNKKAKEDSHD